MGQTIIFLNPGHAYLEVKYDGMTYRFRKGDEILIERRQPNNTLGTQRSLVQLMRKSEAPEHGQTTLESLRNDIGLLTRIVSEIVAKVG